MQKRHSSLTDQQTRMNRWESWRFARELAVVAAFVALMVLLFRAVM
jgi:hypothetical protein